ncbi:GAF domain-containing sensor histidine kinase [Coraliomargarita sp. W4R53]
MNTYLIISSWFNLFAPLVLVASILTTGQRNAVVTRFIIFLLSIAGWAGSYTIWQLTDDEATALLFCKILTVFPLFVSTSFYDFSLRLGEIRLDWTVLLGYSLAVFFALLTASGFIVDGVTARMGHEFWPNAGIFFESYLILFVGYFLVGVWVLYMNAVSNLGGRSSNSIYILFTCFIGVVGGSTNFPLWYDIPIQPYGNGLVAVYVLLLGYAFNRNRFILIRGDFYKILFSLILHGTLALFYVLTYAFYSFSVGLVVPDGEWLTRYFAAFLISCSLFWGVPRVKFWFERLLEGMFRGGGITALEELASLSRRLADLIEHDELPRLISDALIDKLGIRSTVYMSTDLFVSEYLVEHASGESSPEVKAFSLSHENPLIHYLSEDPRCIVLDDFHEDYDEPIYQELINLRKFLGTSVIVPIFAGHQLYGLILLGTPLKPRVWSSEMVSILYNIGAQIGLNLRSREFERRSIEVDKLVSLGTMAAGLSHEIRNPLVSVQTFASLLGRNKKIENIPADFRSVLIRDIKRIENIVDGVAAFSKNKNHPKSVIRIGQVLDDCLQIHGPNAEQRGVEVVVESNFIWDEEVLCSHDLLVQVFTNLLENSLDALANVAAPRIDFKCVARTTAFSKSRNWIDISISDNGSGVSPSIRDRIFDPFITSKDTGNREEKQGMGLGLAISKRIIENHNGAISVSESEWGGAKFTVSLKVFDVTNE